MQTCIMDHILAYHPYSITDFKRREEERPTPAGAYRGPHWDQPNVLAHIRLNDRTLPDGKKVLFVEELQSDWHQQGREHGYKTGKEEQDHHSCREEDNSLPRSRSRHR